MIDDPLRRLRPHGRHRANAPGTARILPVLNGLALNVHTAVINGHRVAEVIEANN